MPLTFQTLTPADTDAFRALTDIYTASIPPAEAKPLATLRTMLARPDYLFLLSRDPSNNPLAFAILYLAHDFTLLEYLATSPARRSAGHGSALFTHLLSIRPHPLLVEVDAPTDPLSRRRVAFYSRHDCRRVAGLNYLLPLPHAPPMHLLIHTPAISLPLPTLRQYLSTLYTQVYQQAPTDPRIATMLRGLPDPIPLLSF